MASGRRFRAAGLSLVGGLAFGLAACRPAVVPGSGAPPLAGRVKINPRNVYDLPDILPMFPGGLGEYVRFLRASVQYPAAALAERVQGKVVVRFIVDEEGLVREPQVVQALRPDCDAEALRIVRLLPRWEPAKQGGYPVACWRTAPVSFVIPPPTPKGLAALRQRLFPGAN